MRRRLRGEATGLVRTTTTIASWSYTFSDLPPGVYVLTVRQEGFEQVVVQELELNVADVRGVDRIFEQGLVSDRLSRNRQLSRIPERIAGAA